MGKGSGASPALIDRVMAAGGHRCAECGLVGERVRRKFTKTWRVSFPTAVDGVFLSADHVVPKSKGGPTTFENLRVLCTRCNSRRGPSPELRPTFAAEEHW